MNLDSIGNLVNCLNKRNVLRHKKPALESVNRGVFRGGPVWPIDRSEPL